MSKFRTVPNFHKFRVRISDVCWIHTSYLSPSNLEERWTSRIGVEAHNGQANTNQSRKPSISKHLNTQKRETLMLYEHFTILGSCFQRKSGEDGTRSCYLINIIRNNISTTPVSTNKQKMGY